MVRLFGAEVETTKVHGPVTCRFGFFPRPRLRSKSAKDHGPVSCRFCFFLRPRRGGLCIHDWLVIIELRALIGDELGVTLDSATVLDTCCGCWEPGGDRNCSRAGGSGAGCHLRSVCRWKHYRVDRNGRTAGCEIFILPLDSVVDCPLQMEFQGLAGWSGILNVVPIEFYGFGLDKFQHLLDRHRS